MSNQAKKICPHCNQVIKADEQEIICPSCGIPHHKKCWDENHGCTTALCPGKEENNIVTPEGPKCRVCGAALKEGQKFCGKCGTTVADKNICPNCGTELKEGQKFCHKCGCDTSAHLPQGDSIAVDPNVCKQCGTVLKPEQKFCHKCGCDRNAHSPQGQSMAVDPNACKQCGTILKPEQKFCHKCGAPRG